MSKITGQRVLLDEMRQIREYAESPDHVEREDDPLSRSALKAFNFAAMYGALPATITGRFGSSAPNTNMQNLPKRAQPARGTLLAYNMADVELTMALKESLCKENNAWKINVKKRRTT